MQSADDFDQQRTDTQQAAHTWRLAVDPVARMASMQAYYHALTARRCTKEQRQALLRDLFAELGRGAVAFLYQVVLLAEVNEVRARAAASSGGL